MVAWQRKKEVVKAVQSVKQEHFGPKGKHKYNYIYSTIGLVQISFQGAVNHQNTMVKNNILSTH